MTPLATSIGSTITNVVDAAGNFFSQLSALNFWSLLLGLALYAIYLLLRSRALFNAVRAAYPGVEVRWRDVWGAYMVGYGINTVFPLGGGNIAQLFLTRVSIPPSSYPTVASALWTGVIFDWFMGLLIMGFAFTQGVFPKPPDFSKLPAFDISFFASHMRFTLFFVTVLGICFLLGFAFLSARVRAFWQRLRQGFAILRDGRRYRREMATWQFASWIFRFAAYWALLDAFHIGGSVRNALLVLAVQVVASVFPFTPGGLGVQQALLLDDLRRQLRSDGVLGRPADRDGRAQRRARLRRAGADLPLQELPRGDRPRARAPAPGERRRRDIGGRRARAGVGARGLERQLHPSREGWGGLGGRESRPGPRKRPIRRVPSAALGHIRRSAQ